MTAWLDNVVALNVRPTTMQTYKSVLNVRILPHLGNMKVQELTPAMLDVWARKLVELDFSYSSIRVAYSIILEALDYAVYPAQLIQSNPATYIKVPKNATRNVIKRTIITPEQFAALLEKYPFGSPFYISLLLLYHTGMRRGEVLGLSWQDVDFDKKRLTVRRQIVCINKPKTKNNSETVMFTSTAKATGISKDCRKDCPRPTAKKFRWFAFARMGD